MITRLSAAVVLGALVFASACDPPSDVCSERAPVLPSDREEPHPFALLRCDLAPELCDRPVHSDVREPDLELAIDLVFVGDGFADHELDDFARRVDTWVEGAREDPVGILHRDPDLFNVHRVDVVSTGNAPDERALGSCVEADDVSGDWMIDSDWERAARAAANAPDVDVIVVVSRSSHGRANVRPLLTGRKLVHMHVNDSHGVLTHELGHALFNLGDEYVDVDEVHPDAAEGTRTTEPRLSPNVSLSADETWGGDFTGAVEGAGRYRRGVYRPTNACRMLDSTGGDPFCPVCSAHIDRWLAARRGGQDGPPVCALDVGSPGSGCVSGVPCDGAPSLRARGWDGNGLSEARLSIGEDAPLELHTRPCPSCALPTDWVLDLSVSLAGSERLTLECVDTAGAVTRATLELGGR